MAKRLSYIEDARCLKVNNAHIKGNYAENNTANKAQKEVVCLTHKKSYLLKVQVLALNFRVLGVKLRKVSF